MLHVSDISKSFGPEPVLTKVSFLVNQGERVALVSPNGSGKTTLLHIIAGLETADGDTCGSIRRTSRLGCWLRRGVRSG
jgi:ATPase subunit of ABC transporter with duplicated ATPase domains